MQCPQCHSKNIKKQMYAGLDCVICKDCGFDERILQDEPNAKKSQKAKGSFSPYRSGGGKRTRK